MKKWFTLILAAVMVIGCLAGCSQTPVETVPDTEPETVPVQQAIQELEVTEPEVTEPIIETISQGKMIRKLYKLANPSGSYEDFESAIAWAVKNGVVTDDAPFDPEAALTHLDMARFLYRYAKALDVVRNSDKLEALTGWVWDESEITEEADREAVAWAIGSGVMQLYQRQILPDEAITAYEYRVTLARLSSLVKAVRDEQQAAEEATEPEETEPEETEESGSENEGGGSSGSGNSGSSSGNGGSSSGNSGGSSSGSSGSSGGSSSGSSGGSGSSGNSGSGSGSSGGSTTTQPTDPPEPPTYSKEEAMAAANNYLAGLGCTITTDVMWAGYSFPMFYDRASIAEYGGQAYLNQRAVYDAMSFVDWRNAADEDNGDVVDISLYRAYCYITDDEDFCGPGYLVYIFYG